MIDLATAAPPAAPPVAKPTGVRYGVLGWACALSMITYIDRVCIKQVGGDMRQGECCGPVPSILAAGA